MRTLIHGSLFSGIGGFDLAAQWAGIETIWQVENDPFCQKILAKHFPEAKRYGDIKNIKRGDLESVDIISGGFPCQPFSIAGKRRGTADDRFLWPEMFRIISEVRPAWVIAENVVGIASMVLAECEDDLAAEGYQAQSFDIPACACGLSTMERHIWIIATNRSERLEGGIKKRLFGKQRAFSCKRGKTNQSIKEFPPIPDLCKPDLLRSRKGFPNFVDRHKALGNAIVPQVAFQFFKMIKLIEQETTN